MSLYLEAGKFLTKVPETRNFKSLTNDKNTTARLFSATASNIPLIYIKKRITDTSNPCRMPYSIFFSLLLYLLMTN